MRYSLKLCSSSLLSHFSFSNNLLKDEGVEKLLEGLEGSQSVTHLMFVEAIDESCCICAHGIFPMQSSSEQDWTAGRGTVGHVGRTESSHC